ncbi:MAG TPA: glycosyl hydrolase [Actinomycetes bacterium]|nr:glycosyl hydrolase [Actinomycetes bacterium]
MWNDRDEFDKRFDEQWDKADKHFWFVRRVALIVLAIVLGVVGFGVYLAGVAVNAWGAPVVIGSSGDYVSGIAQHRYGKLNGNVIADVRFVNIESTSPWRTVAEGGQDANIRRWAQGLRGQGPRLVSFSHEPMSKKNRHLGTAASYKAAMRHVEDIFEAEGVSNVEWVWNATSDSFRGDHQRGRRWYPGDHWVDVIAGESFNRIGCGFTESASFGAQVKEIFAFSRQHHKKFLVAEFASNRGHHRAAWLRDARRFITVNKTAFRGAFYFNSNEHAEGCEWRLGRSEKRILRTFGGI